MKLRFYLFVIVTLIALLYIINKRVETFQRAQAAMVCYYADPGPPLAVPLPPDPVSAQMSEGPRMAALASTETPLPAWLVSMTTRPDRVLNALDMIPAPTVTPAAVGPIRNTTEPTSNPLQTFPPADAIPYETPAAPITPTPTLGVLSLPPEITVTPRPSII